MTLIICESLREIGEMACVTSAWSSRGQTLKWCISSFICRFWQKGDFSWSDIPTFVWLTSLLRNCIKCNLPLPTSNYNPVKFIPINCFKIFINSFLKGYMFQLFFKSKLQDECFSAEFPVRFTSLNPKELTDGLQTTTEWSNQAPRCSGTLGWWHSNDQSCLRLTLSQILDQTGNRNDCCQCAKGKR